MPTAPVVDPCLIRPPHGAPILVLSLWPHALTEPEPVAAWFRDARSAIDAAGVRRVLLDSSHAELASAIGLGQVVRLFRDLQQAGGRLAVCRANSTLAETFRAIRLDRVLGVYAGLQEALDSF
jgi:anti-anti-sigma regulatory factor